MILLYFILFTFISMILINAIVLLKNEGFLFESYFKLK